MAIPGRSARAVLAMLALRPGQVLSTDELVGGLWSDRIPADPTAALYVTLSRLRSAMGRDRPRLRRAPLGYILDAGESEVDVSRVEASLARARRLLAAQNAPAAAALLTSALTEWRHVPPLGEFADLPFAAPATSRLQRLWFETVEAANNAGLSAGRAAEVVERTEAALALEPWREQLVGQLMTALYRTGRQGDALTAYSELASRLRADFGVEPSADLQQLRAQIAAHAVDLAGPPPVDADDTLSLPSWFKAVLEDVGSGERDEELRCRLMLALGEAEHHAGLPTWRATLLQAGEMARAQGIPALVARAALGGELGWSLSPGSPDRGHIELIQCALDQRVGLSEDVEVRLLGAYADELAFTTALEERIRLSERAVDLARATGRPALLLSALNHRFNAIWAPETLDARTADAAEALRLAEAGGDARGRIIALGFAMAAAVEAARMEEADRHFQRFRALSDELGLAVYQWGALVHSAWRSVIAGDLDEAEKVMEEARSFGTSHGRPEAELAYKSQRAALRWAQGRLGEEVATLTSLADTLLALPAFRALEALALWSAGEQGPARASLVTAWEQGSIAGLPHDQAYLSALMHWSEIAAAVGDETIAAGLYDLLAPYADRFAFTGACVYGPVALALGRLAAVTGRESAAAHLSRAEAMSAGMGSTFFAAQARAERQRLGVGR